MTERITQEIRLSEAVSPFGPGAIADVKGESLIAPDMSQWSIKSANEVSCDRLATKLGGGLLLSPPIVLGDLNEKTPATPFWRFPAWRFCERCGSITRKTETTRGKYKNECHCRGFLVPMRFVAVCEGGSHMQDVPWPKWVHRKDPSGGDLTEAQKHCKAVDALKLVRRADAGEGLASMLVKCTACGRTRSMAKLGTPGSLHEDGFRCWGSQPWMTRDQNEGCEHKLLAKQRGATGNYIADIVAAIDIPPGDDPDTAEIERISNHSMFTTLQALPEELVSAVYEKIMSDLGVSKALITRALSDADNTAERPIAALKEGEWYAFQSKLAAGYDPEHSDFIVDGRVTDPPQTDCPPLFEVVDGVGQVRRLREVRALRGFRRNTPLAALQPAHIVTDGTKRRFPAIEQFGEGLFLRFNTGYLASWESAPEVQERAAVLQERCKGNELAEQLDFPSARFIALHTFAHLLIRRLSYASGYPAASLRERVYAGTAEDGIDMAGVLIYTAAGDAQGTLGGLVRLGDEDLIGQIVLGALNDAQVCSNDPVCIESDRHGADRLNLAACHGCCLVSETSCENRNQLLDRQLLLGGGQIQVPLLAGALEALNR